MTNIKTQQILLPKKVYIGDTAELRVTFSCSAQLTADATGTFTAPLNEKEYVIQNLNLIPAGVDYYQLSMSIIPWKTGEIQLPPYLITDSNGEEYKIDFEKISIVSLLEQNQTGITAETLHEQNAPVLIPGTAYKLWIALIILVVLLLAIIRIIIKRKELRFFIQNKRLMLLYKKNKRQTIKKLNLILSPKTNGLSDKEKAEQLQKIMRNYLEVRFAFPFTKTVTSRLMNTFMEATGGLAEETKLNAMEEICSTFVRTDYIRYSGNAVFLQNELSETIQQLIKNIETLEAKNVPVQ